MTSLAGAAPGTLLSIPLNGRFTAGVVVGSNGQRVHVAALDWAGDVPPVAEALQAAPLLVRDHHFWDGEPLVGAVDPEAPHDVVVIGERPVPGGIEDAGAGNWFALRDAIGAQRWWNDALPDAARRAFRDALAHPDEPIAVTVGGEVRTVDRGTRRLEIDGTGAVDWASLDGLGALTEVVVEGPAEGLFGWLATRPIVRALRWSGHGASHVDWAGLGLTEATLACTGVGRLDLPATLATLHLTGPTTGLEVVHPTQGAGVTLWLHGGTTLPVRGLERLTSLCVREHPTVEAASLLGHASLRDLRVFGDPSAIPDVERLADLSALEHLELHACYAVDAARFPPASTWPALRRVVLDGVRKEAVPELKKRLSAVASLEVRGAKTDAWLAANLDNPFRDWVDDHPAKGKAAAAAWKKARGALVPGVSAGDAEAVLRAFVAVFDALDAKVGIDTADRDDISDAFDRLVEAAGLDATASEWLDAWRSF